MHNKVDPKTTSLTSNWAYVPYRKGIALGLIAFAMFGFSYLLVPIYDVLCYQFGVNGKVPEKQAPFSHHAVIANRRVTLQFLTANYAHIPWAFSALSQQISLHPHQTTTQYFTVENTTNQTMQAAAVSSIAPASAAKYIKFTHRFAHQVITLLPHEKKRLPVSLYIDGQLPAAIHVVTLFYTLFDQGAPTHG